MNKRQRARARRSAGRRGRASGARFSGRGFRRAVFRLCDKGTIAEQGKAKKGLFSAFVGVGAMPNMGQGA